MTFDTIPDFNPDAPEAENIAYSAGLNLHEPPADFDTALPDGSTMRQRAETTYSKWYEARAAKGLPIFPTQTAASRETQDAEFKKAYGGLDKLEANLRPDQFQTLKTASQSEPDPEEYSARAINANFFNAFAGRDVAPQELNTMRDAYARQVLGMTGDTITDKAVYQGIQKRFTDDDTDAATITAYSKQVAGKMLENVGKVSHDRTLGNDEIKGFDRPGPRDMSYSPTTDEINDALAGVSERNRPQARRQLMGQVSELNRLFRRFGPAVDGMVSKVASINAGELGDQENAIRQQVDTFTADLPHHPKERGVILAMLSSKLQELPQDRMGAIGRILTATGRGYLDAKEAYGSMSREAGRQFVRSVPFGDPNAHTSITDDEMQFLTRRKELLNLIQGQGQSLEVATDGLLSKGLIKFAPSAWMIPAAFHPVGQYAIASTMAGDSISQDRIQNPGTDEGARFNAGMVSGGAQAVIETLSNTTGAKIIAGKLPSFTAALNKLAIGSPVGRAALGIAAGGAATFSTEYTEEAAQGATDMALQGLASDLSGIRSDIDWTGYLGGWVGRGKDDQGNWQWKLGKEQQDTLLAILPFALVGAGGAGLNHFKQGETILKNKAVMRAHAFTEPEIRSVIAAADPAEALTAYQTAFNAAAARAPGLTEEERDTIAAHRATAIEELKAQNEALSRAGLPRVEKEVNTFTDEDQFIFIHPETDARQAFDTEEEAMSAWWNWSREQEQDHLDTIAAAAEEGFIEHVTGEGQAAEDVNVDIQNRTLTLPKLQAEMETEQATAAKDLAKANTPAQRTAAGEKLQQAQTKLGWLRARIEAMVLDEGLTPAQAGAAFKNTIVAGRVFATSVMDRVVGYTVQLFHGRNLQDVMEEFSEANIRQAIDGGMIDPEILQDDIRNYEKATGARVMDPAYTFTPENPVKLIEGFSNLARAYAFSHVRTGALPATVSRWIEMQTAAMSATVTAGNALSRDISTAGDLRAAMASGGITPRLVRTLSDSIGLDESAREQRLQKRMEDQLAAEAMEGFPEIAEEARGMIPHPDTLEKEQHPLAGEVRRLWESLKKPTRRRTKAGKAIDRTNEANGYFLPVGEMEDLDTIRTRLNQKGFDFDTPAEMLDALDASLSYGKPIYGTMSQGETYSLGRSTVTPKADTQVFPGGEGSPTVIGPATFAIKAHHGTPHKVDRFSLSKIGTGEGAQMFGWGLYFAGAEKVAEQYRNVLGNEFRMDGELLLKAGNYGPKAEQLRAELGEDAADIIVAFIDQGKARVIDELNDHLNNIDSETFDKALDILDRIHATNSGKLYTVNLDVNDEDLLDWDKRLDAQSEPVQAALRSMFGDSVEWDLTAREWHQAETNPWRGPAALDPETMSRKLLSAGIQGVRYLDGNSRNRPLKDIKRDFLNALPENAEFEDVHDAIGEGAFTPEQVTFLKALEADDWFGFDYPAQAISAALSERAGSYDASAELIASIEPLRGDVTHNYVMFDDSKITITAENGQPVETGAAATGNVPIGITHTAESLNASLVDSIGEEELRLEQPRASYEDKRQLLLDFSTSVVSPEGESQGDHAGGDSIPQRGLSGRGNSGIQVLRQRLADDIATDLQVRFIGETIRNADDIATKAMALRNPRFETFYLLAMKEQESGDVFEVLDAMAVTSRVPCSAKIFAESKSFQEGTEEHAEFLKAAGASHYILVHNHPSGDPTPSGADSRVTVKHAMDMEKLGFTLMNHIVINHETFSTIDAYGVVNPSQKIENQTGSADPFLAPATWQIGSVASNPEAVVDIAQRIEEFKATDDAIVGLVTNIRLQVVATMIGKEADFLALTNEQLQDYARSQGGAYLMLHGKAPNMREAEAMIQRFKDMNEDSRLLEMVVETTFAGKSKMNVSGRETGMFTIREAHRFFGGDEAPGERIQENPGETYALTSKAITRIEQAIAQKLTQGPDERAEFYERIRERLASTVLMLRETKGNTTTTASEAEREKTRIRDAIAEARAVIDALPIEARGRVTFSFEDITSATTPRGQANALIRLIQKADDVLETVLVKQYQESFEKLADLAKPDLRQNKQLRGRLTPGTQRLVGKALEAAVIPPEELPAHLVAKQAEIDALESRTPSSPEEAAIMQTKLVELYVDLDMLDTFGALASKDAAGTAQAYQQLLSIYTQGRTARRVLDEAKQAETRAMKAEVLSGLPYVDQAKHADRTSDKGFMDTMEAIRLGLSSLHQVMETLFPKSATARAFQQRVRAADRAYTRAKIDAKDRFDAFTYSAFNLTGRMARRQRDRILAEISKLRTDWNIQLAEGVGFNTEKLTEEQAEAILAGKMKVGWETDRIAMTSLAQALADFRLQRLKAQQEEKQFRSKVIEFQRLTKRGVPGPLHMSDLQALYILQLHDQAQYQPTLDKYGFTDGVVSQIRAKLNPKAALVGDFLRSEYDAQWSRLNPVYRALYGMDMPRIRNYAPGLFESLDSKANTDLAELGQGGGQVNAMSAGFTKARGHHMARPRLVNALSAYWSSQESTEYFIAYAELVRDMRQVFRSPDVRRALEGNYGTAAAKLFSQWLDAIEVDGNFKAAEVSALGEMMQRTLATQSAVGLAFNIGVLFKQLSASFGFLMEMPTKAALAGITAVLRNPSVLKTVWNTESIQQRILAGMSPEDRRLLDAAHAKPSDTMMLLEIGRLPIALADAAFTTASASVAYAHAHADALRNGLLPSQAEAHALRTMDRVVTRTAQPATTQDKSMAELTAKGFGKTLFMFKSDPRGKLAYAAQTVKRLRAGRIKPAEAARKLFWGWAVYGLSAEIMADVWASMSRDDDDPDRWDWKDYAASMIAGPIAGIPLLGSVLEYGIRSTIGTKAFSNSANPLDAAASRLLSDKGLKSKIFKLVAGEDDYDINDLLTAAQQDSSAIAQLAGAADARLAIAPAAIRAVRDVAGITTNLVDSIRGDTPEEKAQTIVKEARTEVTTKREGNAEQVDALAKRLAKLDGTTRAAEMSRLDRDTREAVTRKLKRSEMTASERGLASLPKEARTAAVGKILDGMPATERPAYLARLRSLGITVDQ